MTQVELLDRVAQAWPVEIECGTCNGAGIRPATGTDLAAAESDGWPAAPMRAWWEVYGGWMIVLTDCAHASCVGAGVGYDGNTLADAMQASAIAMLDTPEATLSAATHTKAVKVQP